MDLVFVAVVGIDSGNSVGKEYRLMSLESVVSILANVTPKLVCKKDIFSITLSLGFSRLVGGEERLTVAGTTGGSEGSAGVSRACAATDGRNKS